VLRQDLLTAFHRAGDFQFEVVDGGVDVVFQTLLMKDMRAIGQRNGHSIVEGAVANLTKSVRVLTDDLLLSLFHHGFVPDLNKNILWHLVTLSDLHLRLGHLPHFPEVSDFALNLSRHCFDESRTLVFLRNDSGSEFDQASRFELFQLIGGGDSR